jgi:hypothetical protein
MAERGVEIIDRVVANQIGGTLDGDTWKIPDAGARNEKIEYRPIREEKDDET